MSNTRSHQYEPEERAIKLGKILFVLSFICPYMIDYANVQDFYSLVIYAPTWVFSQVGNQIYGGPTPFALIMFFYWTPAVVAGYLSYRYAKGGFSSIKLYILSEIICAIVTILFILPLMNVSRSMVNGEAIYDFMIPFPLPPVFSLLLIPYLRPKEIVGPWKGPDEQASTEHDSQEEKSWLE